MELGAMLTASQKEARHSTEEDRCTHRGIGNLAHDVGSGLRYQPRGLYRVSGILQYLRHVHGTTIHAMNAER
jgi:hypothetical protein